MKRFFTYCLSFLVLFALSGCSTTPLEEQISKSKAITEYDDSVDINKIDKIKFGKNRKGQSIEWIILEKNENNALLLLYSYYDDDLLAPYCYSVHKINQYDTSGCALLAVATSFVNNSTENNIFTENEIAYLERAKNKNTYSKQYYDIKTYGFVLSTSEYNKYLSVNKAKWSAKWWLRDLNDRCGNYVDISGKVNEVKNVIINREKPNRGDAKYNRGGMWRQVDQAEYDYDVALYENALSNLPGYVVRPAVWVAW